MPLVALKSILAKIFCIQNLFKSLFEEKKHFVNIVYIYVLFVLPFFLHPFLLKRIFFMNTRSQVGETGLQDASSNFNLSPQRTIKIVLVKGTQTELAEVINRVGVFCIGINANTMLKTLSLFPLFWSFVKFPANVVGRCWLLLFEFLVNSSI